MTFANDPARQQLRRFAQRALHHGLWLHPGHNWFLSTAHGPPEIEGALEAAGKAFADVAKEARDVGRA